MRPVPPRRLPAPAVLALAVTLLAVIPAARVHAESWTRIPTHNGPDREFYAPVVWDGAGGRILYPVGNTLWVLTPGSGPVWTALPILSGPSPSFIGASADLDPQGNRILLFNNGEMWELPLGGPGPWHRLTPTGVGPSSRSFATTVVDPVGQRLILFGGGTGVAQYNDLYQLTLGATPTWTRLIDNDAPGSPARRERHSTIFDPGRRRIVVFGGLNQVNPVVLLNDTWALPLDGPPTWQNIATIGGPSPRHHQAAAYDAANDQMIIIGGETWALPFTGPAEWIALPSQAIGGSVSAVYDPAGQRVLLPYRRATLALELGGSPQWSFFEQHIPPLGLGSAFVGQGKFVVQSGEFGDPNVLTGTWVLDLSVLNGPWVPYGGGPQGRWEQTMVWDPVRERALFLAGMNGQRTEFNDMWLLTLGPPLQWSYQGFTGLPPGYGWRGLYDPSGDRLVILGFDSFEPCCSAPTYTNQIYILQLSGPHNGQWNMYDVFPPSFIRRRGASFSYDATRDVAWIYGGDDRNVAPLGDLWRVDLSADPVVTQVTASGPLPASRTYHAAVFDNARDRLLVFGGDTGSFPTPRNEVWQFEPGTNQWTQLSFPVGTTPPARSRMQSAFDPVSNRLLVYGGFASDPGGDPLQDAWALNLNDGPTAIGLALYTVHAAPDRVRIVWTGGEPGMSVRIDRRGGGEWAPLGTRSADGEGRITLEDRDVAAGMRLEYRLAVNQDGVESYFGTTSAVVPSWALDFSATPARRGIRLRIQLPSGEPATVAVFDLAGRQVWSREVGHLGAGVHEVEADGAAPHAGVYFVRLTQAAETRAARVAVFE